MAVPNPKRPNRRIRPKSTRPVRDRRAIGRWLDAHGRCIRSSLVHMGRRRLASGLTTIVIGITLALPAGLFIAAKNMAHLTASWQQSVTISLYLNAHADGRSMTRELRDETMIRNARFVSAHEGLEYMKRHTQLGPALEALGSNPLPAVIRVHPESSLSSSEVQALAKRLGKRPAVDRAQLDAGWVRRLNAIVALGTRAAVVIAVLLGAAVIFIVGNTIGLDIENRRGQIEVMKLLGASDAFIRRPFIYGGVFYGLFGGLAGLVILGSAALALSAPLADLAAAYNGGLSITGLSPTGALIVIVIGIALGWVGSAVAASRHLAAIEPR